MYSAISLPAGRAQPAKHSVNHKILPSILHPLTHSGASTMRCTEHKEGLLITDEICVPGTSTGSCVTCSRCWATPQTSSTSWSPASSVQCPYYGSNISIYQSTIILLMLLQINDEREIVPLLPKQSYFPTIPTTEKKLTAVHIGNWLEPNSRLYCTGLCCPDHWSRTGTEY